MGSRRATPSRFAFSTTFSNCLSLPNPHPLLLTLSQQWHPPLTIPMSCCLKTSHNRHTRLITTIHKFLANHHLLLTVGVPRLFIVGEQHALQHPLPPLPTILVLSIVGACPLLTLVGAHQRQEMLRWWGNCAQLSTPGSPKHLRRMVHHLHSSGGNASTTLLTTQQTNNWQNTSLDIPSNLHSRTITGHATMARGQAKLSTQPPTQHTSQSVRQQVVALSSAEAEYYAASVAGTDVSYLRLLCSDLGYTQGAPTILFEDNMACIYMSQSSAMYHKARHIDTRVYHLRELCRRGEMKLEKVSSELQAADSLTKATPKPLFAAHRDVMMGWYASR
mmetsp:Transcript_30938/g.64147  ORF Transcript_30938/g.64147 Transcript_30938/m.64147 type:complete len:333 (+) Transcript_30938:1777-2775(+)